MKEVNESLYKFESEFEKEKAKIKQLRHSFFVITKMINKEIIESFGILETIKNFQKNIK